MDEKDPDKTLQNQDGVICEFFGIKITTKNPNLAKVLKSDVNDVLKMDVKDVKEFIKSGEPAGAAAEDENVDTKWSSISSEVEEINELLIDNKKLSSAKKPEK